MAENIYLVVCIPVNITQLGYGLTKEIFLAQRRGIYILQQHS